MTRLLEEAFTLACQLTEEQQDALASRIIAELSADDAFDRKVAATAGQLDWLIEEARADFRAGRTKALDAISREKRLFGFGSEAMQHTIACLIVDSCLPITPSSPPCTGRHRRPGIDRALGGTSR